MDKDGTEPTIEAKEDGVNYTTRSEVLNAIKCQKKDEAPCLDHIHAEFNGTFLLASIFFEDPSWS